MKREQLAIGFDLDGVLLYNPARIFRPITLAIKSVLKHKKPTQPAFYYPKSPIEKIMWNIVHWSSLFAADGVEDIRSLSDAGLIRAYVITSRYDCLRQDFDRWMRKLDATHIFAGTFHNKKNLQPHVFKEQKINELKLDYFVEDNWDIVRHISEHTDAKCLWITNMLDRSITYPLKFPTLKKAVKYIESNTKQ